MFNTKQIATIQYFNYLYDTGLLKILTSWLNMVLLKEARKSRILSKHIFSHWSLKVSNKNSLQLGLFLAEKLYFLSRGYGIHQEFTFFL